MFCFHDFMKGSASYPPYSPHSDITIRHNSKSISSLLVWLQIIALSEEMVNNKFQYSLIISFRKQWSVQYNSFHKSGLEWRKTVRVADRFLYILAMCELEEFFCYLSSLDGFLVYIRYISNTTYVN